MQKREEASTDPVEKKALLETNHRKESCVEGSPGPAERVRYVPSGRSHAAIFPCRE